VTQVIYLHRDGSPARTLWSFDSAVRHKLLLLCIISFYGCWTRIQRAPTRPLSFPYVLPNHGAQRLGCYGEYYEQPEDIRRRPRARKRRNARIVPLANAVPRSYFAELRKVPIGRSGAQ
jgi:hypothetical protein